MPVKPGSASVPVPGYDVRVLDAAGALVPADRQHRDPPAAAAVWVMSRIDDVINVAGHRLSTGAMEEVLAGHPDVAECAVIGVADSLKGQLPLGLVVLKAGVTRPHAQLLQELVDRVREHIGAMAAFRHVAIVARLPKTRSGKVLGSTMRAIADSHEYTIPPTIDDPRILEEIADALKSPGYAGQDFLLGCRCVRATASVRELTLSFARIAEMWCSTVFDETNRRLAIVVLRRPCDNSARISASRGVSPNGF